MVAPRKLRAQSLSTDAYFDIRVSCFVRRNMVFPPKERTGINPSLPSRPFGPQSGQAPTALCFKIGDNGLPFLQRGSGRRHPLILCFDLLRIPSGFHCKMQTAYLILDTRRAPQAQSLQFSPSTSRTAATQLLCHKMRDDPIKKNSTLLTPLGR